MIELAKVYSPKDAEDKWYRVWEEKGLFAGKVDPARKPFCIVIPPPNVTGILHMGHALNNTLQDILIRYHRMKGDSCLWMPGTDHAGIATQNVVEKSIAKEGLKRQDLGREKFLERVWQWREQYGSTIIRQLKKLGASCDWGRTRFTMDEGYSEAVKEVFVRLYSQGLIYQGSYIINWCPRCQTALADEEAPHHELDGNLYYLKYPFQDEPARFIVVATTRPETMLGDTAVAVNPRDSRYKKLVGKTLVLPLANRAIRIIADDMVDKKFGTGAVKVTPAHDPNDYATGKKHGLEFINVMYPDGKMNENAGDYKDMDRFEAREVIIEDLKEKGLLEKVEPHKLSAGHCYRCHTLVEPYLSKQWFVRMQPLAQPAIQAVKDGRIKFHPARWKKVYLNWMENIQDWCVSRQIWWGHRIPVYYCRTCQESHVTRHTSPDVQEKTPGVIVAKEKPEKCPKCGSTDIYQDEDVLDTWFSSWLWPFATFGWPFAAGSGIPNQQEKEKELAYFYPASVLITAQEIIFFWVARMIMAGFAFMKDIPFKDVYIHGTVRDIEGKKMSKSLGNVIDPLEIINEYGTDALRFSIILITAQGQDVFLSKERFEQGRNFANKIWNAARFVMLNLEHDAPRPDLCEFFKKQDLAVFDRWILSRFYSTLKELNKYLETFRFNEAANLLYHFFWHEFCDWYLEMTKQDIKNPSTQVVMYKVLEKFLRCLHPFMPFITEEIWQTLHPQSESIMASPWPHVQDQIIDKKNERSMELFFGIVTGIRNLRAEVEVPAQAEIEAVVFTGKKSDSATLEPLKAQILKLCKLRSLDIRQQYQHLPSCVSTLISDAHISILLEGVVDIEKQKNKIDGKISKAGQDIKSKEHMLNNKDFISRAPAEIVTKEKDKLEELKTQLLKLKAVRHAFD